jgi:hypothetical protein
MQRMNAFVYRLLISTVLALTLIGSLGGPVSAVGRARCTLVSVRRSHPPDAPWKLGPWVAKVRVKNPSEWVEHVRGVWHVARPYERHVELKARLQPGEQEYSKRVIEKGDRRPDIALTACHFRTPTFSR